MYSGVTYPTDPTFGGLEGVYVVGQHRAQLLGMVDMGNTMLDRHRVRPHVAEELPAQLTKI